MALLNPHFEDAGAAPGEADKWTLNTAVAGERIAGFGPDPTCAVEDFERWVDLKLALGDDGSGDVVVAFFGPLQTGVEAFEHGWGNDAFLQHFPEGVSVACVFEQGAVEDFESAWDNTPPLAVWDDSLAESGLFDGHPVEAFEQNWSSNEDGVLALDLLPTATASFDLGQESVELFEGAWPLATTI
jgi:hypothetical protein